MEACIAASILFVAAEIVHAREGRPGWTAARPWVVAFAFGLLPLGAAAVVRGVAPSAPAWAWRLPPYAIGGVAAFWLIQRLAAFAA